MVSPDDAHSINALESPSTSIGSAKPCCPSEPSGDSWLALGTPPRPIRTILTPLGDDIGHPVTKTPLTFLSFVTHMLTCVAPLRLICLQATNGPRRSFVRRPAAYLPSARLPSLRSRSRERQRRSLGFCPTWRPAIRAAASAVNSCSWTTSYGRWRSAGRPEPPTRCGMSSRGRSPPGGPAPS